MSGNRKINLYIGNHGKKEGIEDYITNFEYMFRQRGFEFRVSDELQDDTINLVIDEFTNLAANRYIREFAAKKRNAPLVYVLTEFLEDRKFVHSFNNFGGLSDAATLAMINLALKRLRTDFPGPVLSDYLLASVYLPVWLLKLIPIFFYYLNILLKPKERERLRKVLCLAEDDCSAWEVAWKSVKRKYWHRLIYMHGRYLGFKSMLQYADAVVTCHAGIEAGYARMQKSGRADCPSLGVFLPEFPMDGIDSSMLQNKKKSIEITGSITPYRIAVRNRVNRQIRLMGLSNALGTVRTYGFGEKFPEERAAFSLHPPQTARWPYSSPTRIYRSLVVDHNIPVLIKKYGQHPIEDLCLVFEGESCLTDMFRMLHEPKVLGQFLAERVGRYLDVAKTENDGLCSRLAALQK